jgi:hypothetical protein
MRVPGVRSPETLNCTEGGEFQFQFSLQAAQQRPQVDFFSSLLAFFGKGQQRYIPRPANGSCQMTLMSVACSRYATRDDLPAFRQIISEERNVFINDMTHFIGTEATKLAALKKPRSFQILLLNKHFLV